MIFDTDILIWAQRGNAAAAQLINHTSNISVSIVTYMEFVQATKNKRHFSLCKGFFQQLGIETLSLTPEISNRAVAFIERYSFSHGVKLADALIAATAFEYGEPLATANHKHYAVIEGLELLRFRP